MFSVSALEAEMRHAVTLLALGLIPAAPALGAPADGGADAPSMEVVVTGQPYARWDGTRWLVRTQVGVPYPVVLYAGLQHELQVVAYDLSVVLGCRLEEPVGPRRREVACAVEDASISAAPWLVDPPHALEVLQETATRLEALTVRLQAHEDGRVDDVVLVGEEQRDRRVSVLTENLRQALLVSVSGFHLQLPSLLVLGEQWTEHHSNLVRVPLFRFVPGGVAGIGDVAQNTVPVDGSGEEPDVDGTLATGTPTRVGQPPDNPGALPKSFGRSRFDTLVAPAALASSTLVHRTDRYQDRYVVQTSGTAALDIGRDVPVTFQGDVRAVGVLRPADGVLTERVWSVQLRPTPGSVLALGSEGWPAWVQGSLALVPPGEDVGLPAASLHAPPGGTRGDLPPWPEM